MELIHKLGIDWKLLIAQIINFLILLLVLWKFVYNPVLAALEKRSKTIEKGLRDARESEEKLQEIEKLREARLAQAEREVGKLIEKAKNDAERLKKDLLLAAQNQSEDLLRRTQLQLQEEKQKMIQEVKAAVSTFIIRATGKILEREFSDADQKRLTEAITREITTV